MKNSFFLLILGISVLLFSCSGNSEKTKSVTSTPALEKQPVKVSEDDLSEHPGLTIYRKHCLPCHQADGNGVPGMFPSLVNTKWVNGDNDILIGIVIHGMDEEIEVNGEYFNTIMAPLPHLSDTEVSDVLNYVRKKFGTDNKEITPGEVKMVRNSG